MSIYGLRGISRLLTVPFFFLLLLSSNDCNAKVAYVPYKDPLGYTVDTLHIDFGNCRKKKVFIIKDTIDLKGKTLYLPQDITLKFRKGFFQNGVIVGDNTIIVNKSGDAVFNLVHIKGTWKVSTIKSSLFQDLTYDNALKDVFALISPEIHNKVIIEKGHYQVTATKPSDAILAVPSNTDVLLDGDVVLSPNGYKLYSIIWVQGDNISIKGKGSLTGDKYTHTSCDGDWGMGVYIMGGKGIVISNLTIKECWGDCIYITDNANNVLINNCILREGRRQGISIVSAKDVKISNCIISGVRGAEPGYAIDVEPNKGDTVIHVSFNNLQIIDCYGGILSYGFAPDSYLGQLDINNCSISKIDFCPLNLRKVKSIKLKNCVIDSPNNRWGLICNTVDRVTINNSSINGERIGKDYIKNKRIAFDYPKKVIIY